MINSPKTILTIFVILMFAKYFAERYLAWLNYNYCREAQPRNDAKKRLHISDQDLDKTTSYSTDKYKAGTFFQAMSFLVSITFLASGGLGWVENLAIHLTGSTNPTILGCAFIGLLVVGSALLGLPASIYHTFVIEQKHGFNRQTVKGFLGDLSKGIALGAVLGGALIYMLLTIMAHLGSFWWFWAWLAMSAFSLFAAWIYPTLLAPLFNKFSPLPDGDLKQEIFSLAKKIDFQTDGLFVMNASVRSAHGNAYFTGVFGKKRIVLFDTLIEALKTNEIIAVLAHELGHFKLHHVRWMLIKGILQSGLTFYLLSLCLPFESFYKAFGMSGISNHGALVVFALWFSLVEFLIQPFDTYLSRKNEFAADDFAYKYAYQKSDLSSALLKLREKSQSMPICHPWYSAFYYSHPPLIERLKYAEIQH